MTREALKRAAEVVGARVTEDGGGRYQVLQVEAPEGRRWRDGGAHDLRVEWLRGGPAGWKREALEDAVSRVQAGHEPCPLDCECGS